MNIIFCEPKLTMADTTKASIFYNNCKEFIDNYIAEKSYVANEFQVSRLLEGEADKDDIFIFFNSEDGKYSHKILKLINKFYLSKSRIWPIAMENNPECRRPPDPVLEKQSFDVSTRNENRNPMKNNMRAIAQTFSRKIIAQTLSPLYRDEVLYFISHKRIDGEYITSRLADELKKLTRERNVYRDVVNVAVGDDAQADIDKNLTISDTLIFLQTEQAQNSDYILKELCYALINDIPVLWVQIDDASYKGLKIKPGEHPILKYRSEEFSSDLRLEEIADEVEENCFKLIMNSSNQASTYIEYLYDLSVEKKIRLQNDNAFLWAYKVEYREKTNDTYDDGVRKHYIQCFGRNPREEDKQKLFERIKYSEIYEVNQKIFLLSNHGKRESIKGNHKVLEENYDDYIMNLENVSGIRIASRHKRIVISGAFPDCDEIYKLSLVEAVLAYAREIIKNGYTLVFGAHPTFQKLIFDIGKLYSSDVKRSIEMHMDRHYLDQYDKDELQEQCSLILSDTLDEMRKNMICVQKNEMLICLGGKIKSDKTQQGVAIEVELAKSVGIPIALVGSVGGCSAEYAYERINEQRWSDLNPWNNQMNEDLFYNVNHRLMAKKLLETID